MNSYVDFNWFKVVGLDTDDDEADLAARFDKDLDRQSKRTCRS